MSFAAFDPGPYVSPFVEDETTIRARLQAAVPSGMSKEPNTWVADFLEINVAEFNRGWAAIGWLLAQSFPAWATGQQLDAWAAAYGLKRGTGVYASGTVRFTAPAGTAVPPATIVEVPLTDPNLPRIQYQTSTSASVIIGSLGYADVPVVAIAVGQSYDQPVGAVTLLDTPLTGVTAVANAISIVGGVDPQTDDDLRTDVLQQAALPVGAGTVIDYVIWGRGVPGVGTVAVYPQWDTAGVTPGIFDGRQNGSVLLALRDPSNAPVDWRVAYNAQQTIDPSRQVIAMCEANEGWAVTSGAAVLAYDPATPQMGAASTQLQFAAAGSSSVELARSMDLSRFAAGDNVYMWVRAGNWADVTLAASTVALMTDDANYFTAPMTQICPVGTTAPATGAAWWLWVVDKSQFTAVGAPNWADLLAVTVTVTVTAPINVNFDYITMRYEAGALGVGGLAPVGADVSCVSPVTVPITIAVTNSLLDPGFTLVDTPGTTNVTTLLKAALVAFFEQLPPGQNVRYTDVARVIHDVPGVLDFSLSLPAATGSPLTITMAPTQYAQLGPFSVT